MGAADEKGQAPVIGHLDPFIESYEQAVADDNPLPPLKVVVDGLILEGSSVLVGGEPGVGKSALMQQLAFCLVSGVPWLGHNVYGTYKVMIGNAELPPQVMQQRMRIQGREFVVPNQSLFHYTVRPWDWNDQYARLVSACQERSIDVLMLDPLSAILPPEYDELDTRQMTLFTRRHLESLRMGLGLKALVVVHHFKKPNADSWRWSLLQRVSGAYALSRWFNLAILVDAKPGQAKEAILHIGKQNFFDEVQPLPVVRNENFLYIPRGLQDEQISEEIMAWCRQMGTWISRKELANLFGISSLKLNELLRTLLADGLLMADARLGVRTP